MELRQLATTARHFVMARQRWNALKGEKLATFQAERARRIVAFAAERSPFYRAHWTGYDLDDWVHLPTVDKGLMMSHFDTFNTAGVSKDEAMSVALAAERSRNFTATAGGLTVGLSSGTSGHRGLFLATAAEQASWAGVMLARALHRFEGQLRVAFFLRANSNLYETIGGMLIKFQYFDLMLPLDLAVARLNLFQPNIIVGPPSLLGMLAAERRDGRLHAAPDRLISVAEVIEPQDRESIGEVFGAPVHEIYQCTEGLLAISCKHGSLHVQEDLIAAQLVPLEGGEGRMTPIITDLWRWTQPIIRYRLNDIWRLRAGSCPCGSGFRVIEAIEGRCDDICHFFQRDGSTRLFYPDTIRRMVLLATEDIADYEVTQSRPGELTVRLMLSPETDPVAVAQSVRASVGRVLAEYECQPATITVEIGDIPRVGVRKRRRVRNLVGVHVPLAHNS